MAEESHHSIKPLQRLEPFCVPISALDRGQTGKKRASCWDCLLSALWITLWGPRLSRKETWGMSQAGIAPVDLKSGIIAQMDEVIWFITICLKDIGKRGSTMDSWIFPSHFQTRILKFWKWHMLLQERSCYIFSCITIEIIPHLFSTSENQSLFISYKLTTMFI